MWYDHLVKNEKSIQDVIKSYNQDNFHACVDLPGLLIQTFLYFILQTRKFVFIKLLKPFSGNAHWRELYQNMDYCKVILTIRDSEEIWYSSFYKFFKLMPRLYGLPGGRVFINLDKNF